MASAALAPLVARVRALIDAPASSDFRFSDDQIEDALNQHRTEYRYLELVKHPTKTASDTDYLTFTSPIGGDWDENAALYDNDFTNVSPNTTDNINGRWTFSTEPDLPITIVGYRYDRYGAAADLIEQTIVSLAREGAAGASARLTLEGLLNRMRARQAVQSVNVYRGDMQGGDLWQ